MSQLTEQSDRFTRLADELLSSAKLSHILEKYGQVKFVGSYSTGLIMHGDIDIHILREKEFTKEETLNIFNEIVASTKFNSYYIGDWNDTNLHPEFPFGYYIGLKTRFADEKWKIDIWFLSIAEQGRFESTHFNVSKITLTTKQREAILLFKKYRQDNKLKISGQKIYEMVVNDGVLDLESFKRI